MALVLRHLVWAKAMETGVYTKHELRPFSQTVNLTPNLLTVDPLLQMNTPIHVPLLKDLGSTSRLVKSAV